MMQHYLEIKKDYPEMLLFYQMGDFFELFFEDAERAHRLLNISLTSRGTYNDKPIPMAGVPVHAIDSYLAKLLPQNVAAVICEQSGDSKSPGPIERHISRIITAGTVSDEALLRADRDTILLCLQPVAGAYYLAWADISGHRFALSEALPEEGLRAELERLQPAEILVPEDWKLSLPRKPQRQPLWYFDQQSALRSLLDYYQVQTLEGFGLNHQLPALAPAGCLLQYLCDTQRRALPRLPPPQLESRAHYLQLDAASRRNLEIEAGLNGDRSKGLLAHIDHCVSPAGSRLLRRWLQQPLRDQTAIAARHDGVERFLQSPQRGDIRDLLRLSADVERITTRIGLGTVRPRELGQLRDSLPLCPQLARFAELADYRPALLALDEVSRLLQRALRPQLPLLAKEGGLFLADYDAELDRLHRLSEDSGDLLRQLEAEERERSGLKTLKMAQNAVAGFYIEVSRAQSASVPAHWQRKQTLKNTERYTTAALLQLETQVLNAQQNALEREKQLYEELLRQLNPAREALYNLAAALAEMDCLAGLAELAAARNYCRPELVAGPVLDIRGGRHPVVEANAALPFTPNDLRLNGDRRLLIITGANMGGKSTYMRQNALMVLLAAAGSFVPAESARIGEFSRIFTRIGASDDLAGARSTFMVEMTETANILHNADENSLVIMDEIGRGTATFDGLALAWATAAALLERNRALCLFATHYVEMTALATRPAAANVHVSALEHQDRIVFLHRVEAGPASKSYGIQVARLAGLPRAVLAEAEAKLAELEEQRGAALPPEPGPAPKSAPAEPDLFAAPERSASPPPTPGPEQPLLAQLQALLQQQSAAPDPAARQLLDDIAALALDDVSPRQAWDLISQWQRLLRQRR